MGLFMDPRRQPEDDTRGKFARRRAPWLTLVAIGFSAYVLTRPDPSNTQWLAMFVIWIAAVLNIATADWSDLYQNQKWK